MKKLEPQTSDQLETEVLGFWQKQQIFEKSLAKTRDQAHFSFYDGPPFANGLPHFGHSLVTSVKDAMGRYKTMRGYYVERRNGWDCHGLPVEYEIEKKFKVSGKKQILELGLDKFNQACRESVFTYKHEWEEFFDRIGRWTDKENAYATIDNSYIESVWWVLSQVHQKGLLYRGFKSMPYCPRCETPLSNFELNEGYRDGVQDPSLYVKFKLTDEEAYLLAWTTTPWSLPGNTALAVKPEADYVRVNVRDDAGQAEELILARDRLEVLDADYEIKQTFKGQELVGKHYEPLFEIKNLPDNPSLYQVWAAEFVSIEDGTGVLHVAPAFGEDDLNLAEDHDLPVLQTVDSSGRIAPNVDLPQLVGQFFKIADPGIIEYLTERDRVYNAETITHIYPFCYRCDTPLLYYAVSTWFVSVSQIRDRLLKSADPIHWVPEHVKNGRFGKWLEGARDWAISRNRYWGAPVPIWVNTDDETDFLVVESIAQLQQLSDGSPDLSDLHRPGIDAVVIKKDGKTYRRVEEVLDCWFESGSMPYAQAHYPFENQQSFQKSFPADYVGEGLDQTRLWFYVLHVLATVLFDQPAYKNVIVNGMILAADGQKLSKRLRNYPPIEEVFGQEGADSLRYFLLTSPASTGEYVRFSRDGLRDVQRNVFMTLYNSVAFLSLYAQTQGWQPASLDRPTDLGHPLDAWLVARVDQVNTQVTQAADDYDLGRATRPLAELVDDLSNWYVRRSRRLFAQGSTEDQQPAFATLHWALVTTCQLMAPWAPFMSDYLYRHLTEGVTGAAESVHLTDWPEPGKINQTALDQMAVVRSLVSEGLAQRAAAKMKLRQPLASTTVTLSAPLPDDLQIIIREELNVKDLKPQIGQEPAVKVDVNLTDELRTEGRARQVIRYVQDARKSEGLQVGDSIELTLTTQDSDLLKAIETHRDEIAAATLAKQVKTVSAQPAADSVKVSEGLGISITRS